MAQKQTTVGTKSNTAPNNFIYASELNDINDTVNDNAVDAEARLTTLDSRTTAVESTSASIQEYTSADLPETAETGTLAYDLTEETLVYFKNSAWHKVSDNSEIIVLEGFTFRVQTDNTGLSADDQFTLPLVSGNTYNFTVTWGDGNEETITTDTPVTHTFAGGAGTYTVSITGVIQGLKFDNTGDPLKIIEILDFGTLSFDADATDVFYGCSNLVISAADGPDTSLSTDFLWFYYLCSSLTSVPLMDLSSGNRYFAMFRGCSSIVTLPNFDFSVGSNSSKYREMFRSMTLLTTLDNCTFGDTSSDVRVMFRDCAALQSIPPTLDFTNATNLNSLCFGCTSLATFPAISSSNVSDVGGAWRSCSSLTSFPLIDLSGVGNFGNAWDGCLSLADFPAIDMSSGTSFTAAWKNCALNSASVDNVMAALVANGASNLATDLSGGTTIPFASWSAQAQADHATLISRGWTITTN